jgi:hypoxanthine phosphoribosyltransferase
MHPDLETVLVTKAQITKRISALGNQISRDYAGEEISVISIINGAIFFTADVLRKITQPVRLDCVRVSSYKGTTKSQGTPEIIGGIALDLENRHVLLMDDILDTGKTLSMVTQTIKRMKPASLRTCVLLEKEGRREVAFEADYVGFRIPDKFVVGYGLDFAERYRNLPCIGVLRPNLQNPPEWA